MAATRDTWDPLVISDTPLGHELREFARRMLGPGPAADDAVLAALAEPVGDRLEAIVRTAHQCRGRDGESVALTRPGPDTLRGRVAAELERATAALPGRQREVLALRELLRLSYAQIGAVLNLEPPAVASLLARARINLRDGLRGPRPAAEPPCSEREEALRLLARRQDSESLSSREDDWLWDHLGACDACARAHLVMLEAGARYRAWVRR